MRIVDQAFRLLFLAPFLAVAGCGQEEEVRNVSMSELRMEEDGRYFYGEQGRSYSGIATVTKSGKKVSESNFLKGVREGEHKVWWPETGKVRSLSSYKDGFRHGLMTTWDEEGVKLSEVNYAEGAQDGSYKAWFVSGAVSETGNYAAGKRDGVWTSYFDDPTESKKLEEITYKEGKMHGQKQIWLASGQLIYQGGYKDNQMDGRHDTWYDTGVKRESVTYAAGRPTGTHEGWYESGQREFRRFYREDGTPPAEEFWDRDGNKTDGAPDPEVPPLPTEPTEPDPAFE